MATDICFSAVSADIQPNCTNPIFAGLQQVGYLYNKNDILSITYDGGNAGIIAAIALKDNTRGYVMLVDTKNPYAGTQTSMESGDVSNSFTHDLSFIVRDDGPDVVEKVINPLANGEFVAVVEARWGNNTQDNKFVSFGTQKGLKATAITKQDTDDASAGAWSITLQESGTGRARVYVWAGDYASTKALLESTVTTGV